MARFEKGNRGVLVQSVTENGETEWVVPPYKTRGLELTVYVLFIDGATGSVDLELTPVQDADSDDVTVTSDRIVVPTEGDNITAKKVVVGLGSMRAIRANVTSYVAGSGTDPSIEIHYSIQGGGDGGFNY